MKKVQIVLALETSSRPDETEPFFNIFRDMVKIVSASFKDDVATYVFEVSETVYEELKTCNYNPISI